MNIFRKPREEKWTIRICNKWFMLFTLLRNVVTGSEDHCEWILTVSVFNVVCLCPTIKHQYGQIIIHSQWSLSWASDDIWTKVIKTCVTDRQKADFRFTGWLKSPCLRETCTWLLKCMDNEWFLLYCIVKVSLLAKWRECQTLLLHKQRKECSFWLCQ